MCLYFGNGRHFSENILKQFVFIVQECEWKRTNNLSVRALDHIINANEQFYNLLPREQKSLFRTETKSFHLFSKFNLSSWHIMNLTTKILTIKNSSPFISFCVVILFRFIEKYLEKSFTWTTKVAGHDVIEWDVNSDCSTRRWCFILRQQSNN